MKVHFAQPVVLVGLLLSWPGIAATLSSDELLSVCEQALATGYVGRKAQMCTWYVTPCDCDRPTSEDMPRVCIPKSEPTKKLAEQVVMLLKVMPEYANNDGALAAANLLAVLYPCQNANQDAKKGDEHT